MCYFKFDTNLNPDIMKRVLLIFLGIIFFGVTSAQEKYGVIVASTININKAFMLRSSYLDMGFTDTEVLIQKGGPHYRVCIGVYPTRDTAAIVRDNNKKNYKIPQDSWLLKIYDYKKTEKKVLAGKLEGKTVTILDSTKIEGVKKMQEELEEKIYVLDSSMQELKTLNMGMEKKLSEMNGKQNNNSSSFAPTYSPLVPKDSTGVVDISQNMSIYGNFAFGIAQPDPAEILLGGVVGAEFSFEERMHAVLELQFLDGGGGRKFNILAGYKYDFYERASLILSGVVKVGFGNMNPDGPESTVNAFVFQIGFAPEFRLSDYVSVYTQLLFSGSVIESTEMDEDIIGLIGVKYYF